MSELIGHNKLDVTSKQLQFRHAGEKRPFAVQREIQRASRFHSAGTDRRPASVLLLAGRQFVSRSPGAALLSGRRRLAHCIHRLLQQGKSDRTIFVYYWTRLLEATIAHFGAGLKNVSLNFILDGRLEFGRLRYGRQRQIRSPTG